MRLAIGAIFRHETCRLLGHSWRQYQVIHHSQVEDGVWTAFVQERGEECVNCGMKQNIDLTRKRRQK